MHGFALKTQPAELVRLHRHFDARSSPSTLDCTLRLPLKADNDFSFVFDLCGVLLRVSKRSLLQSQRFASVGWQVSDAAATASAPRRF